MQREIQKMFSKIGNELGITDGKENPEICNGLGIDATAKNGIRKPK